ncbi:MAG: hypothetical protein IIC96_15975 [Chloroflexi bacterium]|nr:hypothetical protein [Chloroflexota bacterium]MCI0782418.1 hypothetical protein [Chloroflexota bacterium]
MTTLTVSTYSGHLVSGDEQAVCREDAAQVVVAAASTEIPILADGLLLLVATLISRLVNRVFGTTVYTADPIDSLDYYFPPSCCV